MSLTLSRNNEGNFQPVAEGTHIARCVQVIDLGQQYNEKYGKWSPQVMYRWEVYDETYTDQDGKEMPRLISAKYTQSMGEKSNLYKMLVGWRGKKFSDQELEKFNQSVLVGLPCMLTVTHTKTANGYTYANISAVSALPKGMEAPPQITESIIYDMDDENSDRVFNKLPEFIQKIIMDSKEKDKTREIPLPEELKNIEDDLPF